MRPQIISIFVISTVIRKYWKAQESLRGTTILDIGVKNMWKIRDHRLKSYVIYQELPCRKKKDCFTWLRVQRQDDRVEEYELTSLYEK